MENDKFFKLGKTFYEWYSTNRVELLIKPNGQNLDSEIKRVAELIEYVKEKRRLKEM